MKGIIQAENAKDYITAGKATVTFVSKKTGTRFTYKIQKGKKNGDPFFIRLLTGSDNTRSYSYMGRLVGDSYIHDKHNRAGKSDSPSAKGFLWVWTKLVARQFADVDAAVEIWHEGKCGRCGRTLTVPESIATGIGPVCAGNAAPATRSHNVIKHAKKIQAKASGCNVTKIHEHKDGHHTVEVESTSGTTYLVRVANGSARCSCSWSDYRPGQDPRTGCSHSIAALDAVEAKASGRKLSVWTSQSDADRQHRPSRNVGDGVVVTSRQVNSMLQNPLEKENIVERHANAAKARADAIARANAEQEREAELMAEFAAQEIAQDQAAFEAKMDAEMAMEKAWKKAPESVEDLTMVSRLLARA